MKFFMKKIKSKLIKNLVLMTILGIVGGCTAMFQSPIYVKASENASTYESEIKEVGMSENNTIVVRADGTAWGCGANDNYELGTGYREMDVCYYYKVQSKIPIDNVKDVKCASKYTVFLKNDGTVYECGDDQYGFQYSYYPGITTPMQSSIKDVTDIACGSNHSIFIKKDGTVWACGNNDKGQIGNEINNTTPDGDIIIHMGGPHEIGIENVKKVACGSDYTIFIKNDGTVWGCGANDKGQLGLGNTTNQTTIVKIPIEDVKDVKCGSDHTIFVKNDGTIWGTGYNEKGQLGIENYINQFTPVKISMENVKDISCGANHTIIVKNDGTVWASGYNNNGQLGYNWDDTHYKFFQISIDKVKRIICGGDHSVFIKDNGEIWASGSNAHGELGLGDTANSKETSPINITNAWYLGARYILNKTDNNLSYFNEYGSLATMIYGKSDYDENKPIGYKFDDYSLDMKSLVRNGTDPTIKEVLPDGSAVTIDKDGILKYFGGFVQESLRVQPRYDLVEYGAVCPKVDDNSILNGKVVDKVKYGMVEQTPVVMFYIKDGSVFYFIPENTVSGGGISWVGSGNKNPNQIKVLPLKQKEFVKTTVYKDKSAKALFFLFQKVNGDLVYFDSNNNEVSTGVNMGNVLQIIPCTLNNSTIYLMKDGTLKYLNDKGKATDITLPNGTSVQGVLSNKFIKMSDGLIYTLNNNALGTTNILESEIKTAVNNIIWMKNGIVQTVDNDGKITVLTNVNGALIKEIRAFDNNNAFIVNQDNTTYGVGSLINGVDLKSKNINYDNIGTFISNNDNSNQMKLIIMKNGAVYACSSNFKRSEKIAFGGNVLEGFQEKSLNEAKEAVDKAESRKLQEDVTAAQQLVTALSNENDKTALQNRLNAIQISDTSQVQLDNAKSAVEKAESSKLQEDVTAAQNLVDALENSREKTGLLVRVYVVQVYINNVADATTKVANAEKTKTQANVDAAQASIKLLPMGDNNRTSLQSRLDAVQAHITYETQLSNAASAVAKVEVTKQKKDLDYAQTLVTMLIDGMPKTTLQTRLTAVQIYIDNLNYSTTKVENAESTKVQVDVDAAQAAINLLPEGDNNRDTLQSRLDAIQNYIDNLPSATNIKVTQIGKDSISISWQTNSVNKLRYQIRVGSQYVAIDGTLTATPTWILLTNKNFTIKGLNQNTSYDISVNARNQEGIVCFKSGIVNVTTLN
ncbi:fibronectin type III domain-containing protein [Clostridium sp. HBUAS56017]|uniref:RCC1 domain-containing protein n=1 Tax=Clostridium sp. HBUAS56017 TaxID=2571128 RepID=UPI00117887BA|nr:fibronectin type III domain-containing protein [Clostridium sp. HBUAS56017]